MFEVSLSVHDFGWGRFMVEWSMWMGSELGRIFGSSDVMLDVQ
jgi:hypothetical protein